MKRALQILGEPNGRTPGDPIVVAIGSNLVSVTDTHDGAASRRFGQLLVDAGGRLTELDPSAEVDLRIVIRSTPESPEARLRAEVLEEAADVVLGSARPRFASRLAESRI